MLWDFRSDYVLVHDYMDTDTDRRFINDPQDNMLINCPFEVHHDPIMVEAYEAVLKGFDPFTTYNRSESQDIFPRRNTNKLYST
jgi:hypothetical protein